MAATVGGTAVAGTAQGIIALEDGWAQIEKRGLRKLFRIIQTGGLAEGARASSAAVSSSSAAAPAPVAESFTNEEYAQLYTIIYQMCIQKNPHCWTPQLYERYDKAISQYLTSILPEVDRQSGPFLISEVVRRWTEHGVMRKWLYDFFRYLDRFYVKRHGKKALNEVALHRFRTLLFDKVKAKLCAAILEAIKRDRQGEETDRGLLHRAVSMYVELGGGSLRLFQAELEKPLLQASREFYAIQAAHWISTDSCPDYLRKCEARFREEKKRVQDYLVPNTEAALMDALNDTLLVHHQRELLEKENTGLRALLKSHADADLARLYALYSAVPASLPPIAQILQTHITELGTSLLASSSNAAPTGGEGTDGAAPAAAAAGAGAGAASAAAPAVRGSSFVEQLMQMHDTYFELVRTAFHGHATFQRALKEAFSTIVNRPAQGEGASTAESLASYADDVLRKGGLQLEGPQLERTLDSIVRLFSYLSDKDLFGEFFRKQLATRLLTQRSANADAEKSMIGKLKLTMGAQFTSKLEGMFNDMRNAGELQSEFSSFLRERGADLQGVDFSVHTLTTGFWPSYPMDDTLVLPSVLQNCLDSFRVFYDTRTNNRRLRWIHELGQVSLGGAFAKRKLELVVSTLQAAILLQFNESEELTIQQLTDLTKLAPEVVKQTLKSLVSGRAKLLLKSPAEGYSVQHRMRVNMAFTSAALRVRVPAAVRKSGPKERDAAAASVAEDRKHAVEACIVRIMKARKVMQHQQLMIEVSGQLLKYFQPDPRAIKQRIEDLIQREYMKRDEEQASTYHYLA